MGKVKPVPPFRVTRSCRKLKEPLADAKQQEPKEMPSDAAAVGNGKRLRSKKIVPDMLSLDDEAVRHALSGLQHNRIRNNSSNQGRRRPSEAPNKVVANQTSGGEAMPRVLQEVLKQANMRKHLGFHWGCNFPCKHGCNLVYHNVARLVKHLRNCHPELPTRSQLGIITVLNKSAGRPLEGKGKRQEGGVKKRKTPRTRRKGTRKSRSWRRMGRLQRRKAAQPYYENVSENISNNLLHYVDGGYDSLRTANQHIQWADENEAQNAQPKDFDWARYNLCMCDFPPNTGTVGSLVPHAAHAPTDQTEMSGKEVQLAHSSTQALAQPVLREGGNSPASCGLQPSEPVGEEEDSDEGDELMKIHAQLELQILQERVAIDREAEEIYQRYQPENTEFGEPSNRTAEDFANMQFGRKRAIYVVCSLCKRYFHDVESVLKHQEELHPSTQCSYFEVEDAQSLETVFYPQVSSQGIRAESAPLPPEYASQESYTRGTRKRRSVMRVD